MRMIYTAIISPIEEGKGYLVRVPDLPGCITTGRTLAEVLDNVRDALAVYLCSLEDTHDPFPTPRPPEAFSSKPGEACVLVDADTVKYRKETDTRAVRKNVSIPAWMATMAEQRGVNCSQVLQDALRSMFA